MKQKRSTLWFRLAVTALMAQPSMRSGAEAADEGSRVWLGSIPPSQPLRFEATPNADGAYVYEATSARALMEGVDFQLSADSRVEGLTTAVVRQSLRLARPNHGGLYWRLQNIPPGPYWVGITYRSDRQGLEAPQHASGRFNVYLNGRQVQCSAMSDPVQIAPGVWVAEAQAGQAETLKEGDELAVRSHGGHRLEVVRLTLHPTPPRRGAHRWRINPGPNTFMEGTALGITVESTILAAPGRPIHPNFPDPHFGQEQWMESVEDVLRDSEGRGLARMFLANPLPAPVEVHVEGVVRAYLLREAGRVSRTLTLEPHARIALDVPFVVDPADRAYSINAKVRATNPPDLGWPAFDELAFFDGLRHLIPWENPFVYASHLRVNFKRYMGSERGRLALHRDPSWEGAFTTNGVPPMPPPPDLRFTPRVVPPVYGRYLHGNEPDAKAIYVRRTFRLPDRLEGRRVRVIVDSVSSEGTLYVNGRRLGNVRGFNTPLIGDATDDAKSGANEVVIVVRGKRAITNPAYGSPQSQHESTLYLEAPGNVNAHLAMHGGVWVELTPDVEVQGLKVDTSVRKTTVAASFTVRNHRDTNLRLTVNAWIDDGSETVLRLGTRALSVAAGGETPRVVMAQAWPDPKRWSWNEPNLYVMSIELKDAETGERIDLAHARFGFRESWMERDTLFFNGHPVRLKGGGCTRQWAAKGYSQLGRGAVLPDYCDEVGDLATELITGLVNTPSRHNVESDRFWETTEANALARLRRKWNHPSIIAWDLSNEWYNYAPYSGCDMEQAADRFMNLSAAVEAKDPSRWTFFNGDYDIGGRHYNLSAHYMLGAVRFGYEFNGHSVYLPDGLFLRPLDRDYHPGEEVLIHAHQNQWVTMGEKVLMDNENLWKVSRFMPPGTSVFMGEECVLAPFMDETAGAMIWMWKQDFDAHRDMNMAAHSNHDSKPGTITRAHLLQTFIMPDVVHHAFSGRTLARSYSLLNDRFRPATLSFRWRLAGPDGGTVSEGSVERRMAPAETWRSTLSFTAPETTRRTRFTLELRLYSEGEFVCGEDRDLDVWPDLPIPPGPLDRDLFLFDPTGGTAAVLREMACDFTEMDTLEAPEGDPAHRVVIIGEDALDETTAREVARLGDFADAGGRVLILAQKVVPQGLPARIALESREWVSQPYVRFPDHPVLKGIRSWDLHFWAPDRVSARGAYTKPAGAAAIPLIDSGSLHGLEWVQMMALYRGAGSYLLAQLALVSANGEEPMARELFARTIAYLAGREAFRSPGNTLRLVAGGDSAIEQRLTSVRATYERRDPPEHLDSDGPWMVEAWAVPDPALMSGWRQSLLEGATLILVGAQPKDAPWIEMLAERPVRIGPPRYRMWAGRGYRDGFDPLTAGLSQLDLFWKQYFWNGHTSESPDYVIEPLQNASAEIEGARERVFPGALLDLAVGKGRLILDQRRWITHHQDLDIRARRNLAALVLGLNVAMKPAAPRPELPADVVWKTVDLAPYANRAFYDEVAQDGRGGWSDQGPDADFRSFPTGEQDFQGVPFTIGDGEKSVIVLGSAARPSRDNLPYEVTLPMGFRMEGIQFLHTSTHSGGEVGAYRFEYEDGETRVVPLVNGRNIRDWTSHNTGAFPNDGETQTFVAWTGSNPMFNRISAYRMLWVNPRPETPVKAVHFVNRRRRSHPILIAMTAAVRVDPEESATNLELARKQLMDAKARLADGDAEGAKAFLTAATRRAPSLQEAHEVRADLGERTGDDDELARIYRRWTRSNPPTPQPWNRLGELLEKRGDDRGALNAYRRSLEVEWNQPPVIEARTRLEKLTDR